MRDRYDPDFDMFCASHRPAVLARFPDDFKAL
jgi:hypothetical protein